MKEVKKFLSRCREYLEKSQRTLWIAFQSNVFTDTAKVIKGFTEEFEQTKTTLANRGWLLPSLNINMRNQKNIAI